MNPKTRRAVYKPTEKTVVTEIKQFVVDSVRRVGAGFHSVATKITDETLDQKDVVITLEKPYTLLDVHNVCSIQTPFPIIAEFTAFGEIPTPDTRTEQTFTDAVITYGDAYAGRFITVTISDADQFTMGPLEANVINLRTAETEKFKLGPTDEQGVYTGYFQTQNNAATGVDFDGVLYCQKDDMLRVYYTDPYGASGKSVEVVKEFVVGLDFKETTIQAPHALPFDKRLSVRVLNPVSTMVSVKNKRTSSVIEQMVGNYQPILLGYEDGELELSVQDNDIIVISTSGKNMYGEFTTVSQEVIVSGVTIEPELTAISLADVRDPFVIKVLDYNLPANPFVSLINTSTLQTTKYPLVEEYPHSGRYAVTLPNLLSNVLPGQLLQISYTAGEKTVSKNVDTIMGQTDEVVDTKPLAPTLSAPLRMTINGQFFLNGSFAGTIKLYAIDSPVRCTILKA